MTGRGRQVHVNALCTKSRIPGGNFGSAAAALSNGISAVRHQGVLRWSTIRTSIGRSRQPMSRMRATLRCSKSPAATRTCTRPATQIIRRTKHCGTLRSGRAPTSWASASTTNTTSTSRVILRPLRAGPGFLPSATRLMAPRSARPWLRGSCMHPRASSYGASRCAIENTRSSPCRRIPAWSSSAWVAVSLRAARC